MKPTVGEIEDEVGAQLRRLRLQFDLTQEEVADAAGVSIPTIAALEAGGGSRLATLIAVLRVLDREDVLLQIAPEGQSNPMAVLRAREHNTTPPAERQRASRRR